MDDLSAGEAALTDRIDLSGLWMIFRRRIRLFFYTAIIIFDIAALIAVYWPRSYTATAVVVLNGSDVQVAPTTQKQVSDVPESNSDVETQIAIVTSRDMAMKVVDYLKLTNDPDMQMMLVKRGWLQRIGLADVEMPGPLTDIERARLRALIIGRLTNNLEIRRVSSAYAFSIGYSDPNPIRAAAIANAFANLYAREQVNDKRANNQTAVALLGERIETLKEQAHADFDAVQTYRIRNNLLSTTGATLTEQEISAYNQQVASARAEAAAASARLSTARAQLRNGSSGDDVGEALSSPVIQSLRIQRAQLGARVAEYAGTMGPKNPDLVDSLRQLAEIDAQIQNEINRVMSNLEAQARVSAQRLASLSGSLSGARGTLAQNNQAMVELDDLQRKADASQQLYETYLSRYKEAVAANGAERTDTRLVSDARIPTSPSSPKTTLVLALGALLGIAAGFAAAMIAELSFSGLTSADDVRRRVRRPYLGGVPELKTVEPHGDDPIDTVRRLPRSAYSESVRGILSKLREGDERAQVIMVSSALPHEGKTTLAASLAEVAARAGEQVLVIDCDSARHEMSDRFGAKSANKGAGKRGGLREVLSSDVTIGNAIIDGPEGSFSLLPIVRPFDGDQPRIDAAKMATLVHQLRDHFGLIIIDTAPLLPVTEGRDLATIADRIAIVTQWRKTSYKALSAAIDLLPADVQGLVGVALTRIDMKRQSRFVTDDPNGFYNAYRGYYHA